MNADTAVATVFMAAMFVAAAYSTLIACRERGEREALENENADLLARLELARADLSAVRLRLDALKAAHDAAQQGRSARRCMADALPEPDDALDDAMWDAMLGWADQC